MELELIIKAIMGLVVLLAVLIFLLFLNPKKKESKKESSALRSIETKNSSYQKVDFASLVKIVKNKNSSSKELYDAVGLIIKHYGTISKKVGIRLHPDFEIYADLLFTICRHKNTNKDIVVYFDRELRKLNPEYRKEINEAVTKGLNSRGA